MKKPAPQGAGTGINPTAPKAKKSIAPPQSGPEKLAEKMKEIHLEELERVVERRSFVIGYPYVNLKGFPINPDALKLLPQAQAESLKVLCFLYSGKDIRLGAMEPKDPQVQELLKTLTEKTGANGSIYLISEESLKQGLKLYAALPQIQEISYNVEIKKEDLEKYQNAINNFRDLEGLINKVTVTDLTTLILATSLKINSSDIHIEAEEKDIAVRYRVDGLLQKAASIEKEKWNQVISRIKLLAGVKINVADRPQDGRITIQIGDEKVEVRASFLPTAFGESVVMRVLKSTATSLKFQDLGVEGKAGADLALEIARPNGMIITTGPTGSGKTTTLYAILNSLNVPGVKIITLEDPIEYKLPGIAQSQIDVSRGYTFAAGLRSILRQDPDIVMVGEIRDLETAEIATQAALTGHLVVSTIHTNSAAGAIPRFLSMGVKPFLLAPALNAVIGQRLLRRLCSCKVPVELPEDQLARVKQALSTISPKANTKVDLNNLHFYGPKEGGCEKCGGMGYKGRIGIYEIFTMSKEIEAEILSHEVSEYKMQELAIAQGMVTMVQDGLLKALEGITSVDEVFGATE